MTPLESFEAGFSPRKYKSNLIPLNHDFNKANERLIKNQIEFSVTNGRGYLPEVPNTEKSISEKIGSVLRFGNDSKSSYNAHRDSMESTDCFDALVDSKKDFKSHNLHLFFDGMANMFYSSTPSRYNYVNKSLKNSSNRAGFFVDSVEEKVFAGAPHDGSSYVEPYYSLKSSFKK